MILVKQIKKLPTNFFNAVNIIFRGFFSYRFRPANVQGYNPEIDASEFDKATAVIIQGGLIKDHAFTLETVRAYRKIFGKHTYIIVSTWVNEDEHLVKQLADAGAIVVQSEPPTNRGISNVNMQIVSTQAGIQKAKELNVEYILKTRTDVRMYATNIVEFLYNMLQNFPATSGYAQKYRILGFSLNTFKYRLYDISDISLFGHISDMTKYWDIPLDPRTSDTIQNVPSTAEWSKERMCELYLSAYYLEKIGRKLTWTLEDSFSAFADNFCIIDQGTVDMYWYKYNHWKIDRRPVYKNARNDVEIDFKEWFILYSKSRGEAKVNEKTTKLPIGSEI